MAIASMEHPIYTAHILKTSGEKIKLKDVITDLSINHGENDLAEKVTLSMINVKVSTQYLYDLISVKDQLYVYANTGSGAEEVFRGIIWERKENIDTDRNEIPLVCYDRLIYLQESKDNLFVKKGKNTKNIIDSIASDWGFTVNYKYTSITHGKIVYRSQSIADMFISLLDEVKKKTGIDYIIKMNKNEIIIDSVGMNSTIYKIQEKQNMINCSRSETMDGMVTKIKIVKSQNSNDDEYTTVANVSKNVDIYGTLQDIIVKNKDDSLSEAKEEANTILNEKATPKREDLITAVDNPWIKKGDKIYINSGTYSGYYIAQSIEHDAKEHKMYLKVKVA